MAALPSHVCFFSVTWRFSDIFLQDIQQNKEGKKCDTVDTAGVVCTTGKEEEVYLLQLVLQRGREGRKV